MCSEKDNILYLLSYKPYSPKIKIEINLRMYDSHYEIHHIFGIPIQVMVQSDMFAHKLMALYERIGKTSRDIFDVYYFAKNHWPINKSIVENRSKMTYEDFLTACIDKIQLLPEKHILDG